MSLDENWQPSRILSLISSFPSSSHTAKVETDLGIGYLKAMGGRESPHTLACELIATRLASSVGLRTSPLSIIEFNGVVDIPFIDSLGKVIGQATAGPALVSKHMDGDQWDGGKEVLRRVDNKEMMSGIVAFDTWTQNCDRHCPPLPSETREPRKNLGNVWLSSTASKGKFTLVAIDHGHCFSCGRDLSTHLLCNLAKIRDERVYGLFKPFRHFIKKEHIQQHLDLINELPKAKISDATRDVPQAWGVPDHALCALVDFLHQRGQFISDNLVGQIFEDQRLFEFPQAGDGQ